MSTELGELEQTAEPLYRELSDWVVLRFLDDVRQGRRRPGTRLLESELSARYRVSRAPVRDALHKLERLGVIERRPPRGAYIRTWGDKDRAEVLALLDALILLSVQLSIGQLTEQDLAELQGIIDEAANSGIDDHAQLERDARFHLIIARRSGNGRLVELMQNLQIPQTLYQREAHDYLEPHFWHHIHADLLETLRRGDLAAAVACCLHNASEARTVLLKPQS